MKILSNWAIEWNISSLKNILKIIELRVFISHFMNVTNAIRHLEMQGDLNYFILEKDEVEVSSEYDVYLLNWFSKSA